MSLEIVRSISRSVYYSILIHVNAHIQQQHISQIRETVNRCGEPERRRSLWKQIAAHMLRDIGDDDVEKVMKVRNDSEVGMICSSLQLINTGIKTTSVLDESQG